MKDFNSLYGKHKDSGNELLDNIAKVSWHWLLAGKKMIVLLQTHNPDFELDKVGGFVSQWNPSEWANSSRG